MSTQKLLREDHESFATPDAVVLLCPDDIRRIDDPRLTDHVLERNEKNNLLAAQIGLPTIGQRLVNPYGLEFVVDGHVHLPTANTVSRWRDGSGFQPVDLYPSVIPSNLSKRLEEFVAEVDRCTSKTLLILDTTPQLRRDTAIPGGHYVNTVSNPGTNLLFLDAANAHETHIAHEIGHLWVQYVDEAEDMRVLKDVSNPQRLHQLHFVQSFVTDLRVNEIICAKGFDMAIVETDEAATVRTYNRIASAGWKPESAREGVFVALQLATHFIKRQLSSKDFDVSKREVHALSVSDPKCYELAEALAGAVLKFGYVGAEAIRSSIDECLKLAFEYTADGIDLLNDLVAPNQPEPDFDKNPSWLEGASPAFKRDFGRLIALGAIPSEANCTFGDAADRSCFVAFTLPDGSSRGPWTLNHPNPWRPCPEDLHRVDELNQQRRVRNLLDELRFGPLHPDGRLRCYMAGAGRFLSAVREQEFLEGEPAYAYARGNPVTFTDPSGNGPSDWDGTTSTYIRERQSLVSQCLGIGWNLPICKNSGLDRGTTIHMMRCIIGCESDNTGWPNNSIMWPDNHKGPATTPSEIGDPKATGAGGGWNVGPARINAGCQDSHFKYPYQDWYSNECHNIIDGLALLCYRAKRYGAHLPPYWSGDRICYDRCMKLPVYYGPTHQRR